jgi:shikimate dehydrogenase
LEPSEPLRMNIDGHTQIIAHIGYPTGAFKAPMIYNPYFESIGLNAAVVPMGVRAEDFTASLPGIMRMSNVQGALITMPHKISVVALLDEVSTAVKIAGSCNAVVRRADGSLYGDIFDGEGFVRGLAGKGCQIQGARALVIGSGGVGSAIAASLAAAGVVQLALFDTNAHSSQGLATRLSAYYPSLEVGIGSADPAGFDIVVNATPLGMHAGDPMPLDVSRISPTAFVGEVVMKSERTAFLTAATARGCKVQLGIDMLFEQIPLYLALFGFPSTTPDRLRELARVSYA